MKCNCKQYNRSRALLGHVVRLSVVAPNGVCVDHAMNAAFQVIERLQHLLDPMRPCSVIANIDRADIGDVIPVPNQVYETLCIANDVAYRTDGLFDVVAAGTGGAAEWTDLDLSVKGAVRLRKKLRFSLGGLVRGFAADLAVKALKEMNVGAGLVDIGGCIRAFGPRAWRIEYGASYDLAGAETKPGVPIVLQDGSMAGVGSMFAHVSLLDPHEKQVSSTQEWQDTTLLVRAKACVVADALTTVAALRMAERERLLEQFGARTIVISAHDKGGLQGAHVRDGQRQDLSSQGR